MVQITITDETRQDLLCSAIEGGSNYWYFFSEEANDIIDSICPPDNETPFVDRLWKTLKAGKSVPINDAEDETEKIGEISLASIDKGEQIMADKHSFHLADILAENADANTGDVWFQLAALGEIVYG